MFNKLMSDINLNKAGKALLGDEIPTHASLKNEGKVYKIIIAR